MTRGIFITLEGGEGSGKSTQARRLAAALRAAGRDVVETREPGGTPGAEAIRTLLVEGEPGRWTPMTEALLHFAARADHVARLIQPALDRGAVVVCDRFVDSTIAYQGAGQGVSAEALATLAAAVLGKLRPHVTLIYDVPVSVGLARAAARSDGAARYEAMGAAFHENVRRAFLAIAHGEPNRCLVIDATADADTVARRTLAAVSARLGVAQGAGP
jgi:dTMP kinase